jgi:hypothetical protein
MTLLYLLLWFGTAASANPALFDLQLNMNFTQLTSLTTVSPEPVLSMMMPGTVDPFGRLINSGPLVGTSVMVNVFLWALLACSR